MASTPAVGPRPTTRTNTSAQTSSGTLRNRMSSQRTPWRTMKGSACMRPGNAETESALVDISVSGIATSNASAMPAVAMATVRQHSRATNSRNSPSIFGGEKSLRKRRVDFSVSGSNSVHGLNSVRTSAGASRTNATQSQKTRDIQAGSRSCGDRMVADAEVFKAGYCRQ